MPRKLYRVSFFFALLLALGFNQIGSVSGDAWPNTLSLPLVVEGVVKPSTLGAEISMTQFQLGFPKTKNTNLSWVRYNGLFWSDVQPSNSAQWNWSAVSNLENDLKSAGDYGMRIDLVIRSTPGWAQYSSGYLCGAIQPSKLTDFAKFVSEVVKRYSAPPYNVLYFEIGNEMDVPVGSIPGDSAYGCWGDNNDAYFGGGAYANMLKVVYPALKNANPAAKLVLGGLLLDCNPDAVGACADSNLTRRGRFFEGILLGGGGPYFDYLNYHAYTNYYADGNAVNLELAQPAWVNPLSLDSYQSGAVMGKLNFLRGVMSRYSLSKPVLLTEVAIRLRDAGAAGTFQQSKADYATWVFVRDQAEGIQGTFWYTLDGPGWDSGGLLDAAQAETPAYKAMRYASVMLVNATFNARTQPATGIQAFEFVNNGVKFWVVFNTLNTAPTAFSLPAGVNAVYDQFGNLVTPLPATISADHPLFLVFGS